MALTGQSFVSVGLCTKGDKINCLIIAVAIKAFKQVKVFNK